MFQTSEPHWIDSEPEALKNGNVFQCQFKFQHVETMQSCWLMKTKKGLIVSLENIIRAITPGQYAVFYNNNQCLGSARIFHSGICKFFTYKYKGLFRTKHEMKVDGSNENENINSPSNYNPVLENEKLYKVQNM